MTRWHGDDLFGSLLRDHASEGWRVINFPALAETNDVLGRHENEPLWPERFDLKTLRRVREAVGSSTWLALYQGRPAPEDGAVFRRDWFKSYGGPIDVTRTIFSIDSAFKANQSSDYSVIMILSESKNGIHLRSVSRGRWEFPQLQSQVVGLAEIWRPSAVLVEDAASEQSLIQALKANTRLPILPVRPMGDKVARAHAVSPTIESGRVVLPESAPWLDDFLEEAIGFPTSPHDDQVDALTQGLGYLRGSAWPSSQEWADLGNSMRAHEARKKLPAPGAYSGTMTLTAEGMIRREDGVARTVNGVPSTAEGMIRREDGVARTVNGVPSTNLGIFSGRRGAW